MEVAEIEHRLAVPFLNETEILCLGDTACRVDPEGSYVSKSKLHLTSHRLIFYGNSNDPCRQLRLDRVRSIESKSTWLHGKKITISLLPSFDGAEVSIRTAESESLADSIRQALRARTWQTYGFVIQTSVGGVSRVIRRQEGRLHTQQETIKDATVDLEALKKNAAHLAGVAQELSKTLARGDTAKGPSDRDDLSKLMLAYGLADAGTLTTLSRSGESGAFFLQLAKQIDAFADRLLKRDEKRQSDHAAASRCSDYITGHGNGMILLHDLFCLYNRARGTDPISPEELLAATKLLDQIPGSSFRLRAFQDKRVFALQHNDYSDEVLAERLSSIIVKNGALSQGATAPSVANALGISVSLSLIQLLAMESKGFFCRDESEEGTTFYPNIFSTAVSSAT